MSNKLIGTSPNQVPSNADLGTLAYQDADGANLGTLLVTDRIGIDASGTDTLNSPYLFTVADESHGVAIDYVSAYPTKPGGLFSTAGGSTWPFNQYGNMILTTRTDYGGYYDIALVTASTNNTPEPRLVVKSSGKVGIGTTDPDQPLHVVGTRPLRLERAGVGEFEISIDNVVTGDDLDFVIEPVTSSAGFQVRTKNSANALVTAINVNKDGNVGLGTTNPAEVLDVDGNISRRISSRVLEVTKHIPNALGSGSATRFLLVRKTSFTDGGKIVGKLIGARTENVSANNSTMLDIMMDLGTGASYPKFTLEYVSGYHANGYTDMTARWVTLDFDDGNGSANWYAIELSSNSSSNWPADLDILTFNGFIFDTTMDVKMVSDDTNSYNAITNITELARGSTKVFMHSNVGIGTTNPQDKLSILDGDIGIKNSSGRRYRLIAETAGGFTIRDQDAAQTRIHIDTSGNTGIGTASPDLTLHVDGANGYPASSGSTPVGHIAIRAKDAGSSHGGHIGVADAAPWGTWIQAQDANNLATEYPLLLNPNGGNVGIGTTSPTTSLHVNGPTQDIEHAITNNASAQWSKIGTISGLAQGGNNIHLHFKMHSGYNAANTQDYTVDLFMKTSNGSSTNSSGGSLINSWWYKLGNSGATPRFKWKAIATNDYELFMYVPNFSSNSSYTVKKSAGSWANSGAIFQTDPGADSTTVLEAEDRLGFYTEAVFNSGLKVVNPNNSTLQGSFYNNGVREYSQYIDNLHNNGNVNFDVPVTRTAAGYTVYYECMYNHFGNTTYGAWRSGFFSFRSDNNDVYYDDAIKNHGNSNAGSWTVSLIGDNTATPYIRFNKSAGSYGGNGDGHIFVRGGAL